MTSGDALQQYAWLYIREDQSVYVRVEHEGDMLRVTIDGPKWAHATYDFHRTDAMDTFLNAHRARLESSGYQLHAKAERRVPPGVAPGEDRRRA